MKSQQSLFRKKDFLKECKDLDEENYKALRHDILSKELEMMKMGGKTQKGIAKELEKASKDLKKM